MGRLPVELILEIFSYLPLFDAWRLQRVNERWRAVLSQERFRSATVVRYDTHDAADSVAAPHSSIESKFRHVRALRLGRAFSLAIYDDKNSISIARGSKHSMSLVGLKRDTIAYARNYEGAARDVVVRNLVTGNITIVSGEARETIGGLIFTSSLLAFVPVTGGRLYVKETTHDGRPVIAHRLPSSTVRPLTGDEKMVALLLPGESPGSSTVAVLRLDSGSLKAFQVAHQTVREGDQMV